MSSNSRNSIDNSEKIDEFTNNSTNVLTNVESAEEKRLLKKIDLRIIPLVTILQTLSFLDRVNIGNAKLAHLERDLGLAGDEYNWALGIFFLLTNNLTGDTKRAVGTAMIIAWGNIGGEIRAQIYRSSDVPAYKIGHSIALSLLVVAVIITIIQHYLLKRINKYKLENPDLFFKRIE
ncbi:27416_t:CDS:2 [Gigaspora margarita]|uniref:27416_t:CDS:1 n=1 Tax=Gigaspora margarita TaxID=4874 RepID=A0ABN7UTQ6_GIGMA|nr:27416_t:CDS:2 [Gigaspora margarita]